MQCRTDVPHDDHRKSPGVDQDRPSVIQNGLSARSVQHQISTVNLRHRTGVSKSQYLSVNPSKKAGISRGKFEALVMSLDQEILGEIQMSLETGGPVAALFREDVTNELD
jgi:hypothetical protein